MFTVDTVIGILGLTLSIANTIYIYMQSREKIKLSADRQKEYDASGLIASCGDYVLRIVNASKFAVYISSVGMYIGKRKVELRGRTLSEELPKKLNSHEGLEVRINAELLTEDVLSAQRIYVETAYGSRAVVKKPD